MGKKWWVYLIIVILAVIVLSYLFSVNSHINDLKKNLNSDVSPATDLEGTWYGSGTFTNNCANPACKYIGTMNPPSILLNLQQNGNTVIGTITFNFQQFQELIQGTGCQSLQGSGQISNGVISSSRLTFTDPGGNSWSLNVLSDNLQGIVSNNQQGCLGLQSSSVSLSK